MKPVFVDANCADCGQVSLMIWDLRCGTDPASVDRGLAEYQCPQCKRYHYTRLGLDEVVSLRLAGAREFGRVRPFELLETHEGPPIEEDELIDMMMALEDEETLWASIDS